MIVDIVIILLFLSALVRGRELGLVQQLFSTVGFFGGLFLGAALEPHIVSHAASPLSRTLLTVAVTLGCALMLLSIGEYIGVVLKSKLRRLKFNRVDVALGAAGGGLTLLLTVWLVAPVLISLPFPGLQQAVRGSWIVTRLERSLPSAPNVVADLGHVIDPNGFPQVFTGLEPTLPTNTPLPNLGSLNTAVKKDRASVVKIEGRGCGGIVEGSGFVAGNGFVVTNAHVVAGVSNPVVLDDNGEHATTVVWFDPNLDLAVLRVSNLAGHILTIDTSRVTNGTVSAVLGYPGGGNFTAGPAKVLEEFTAVGRNIYGEGSTSRNVYGVKANVIPGNSGGPLVTRNGSVIGIVFAESTTYNQVGYALATPQVVTELHQAEAANTPTSTGQCAE
ncbi:MAG TPA: MarP family serine protease [Candidatus Saccharimonadales bacterium]|jgi:S1-C subfamily serine protease